ncbi:hypothetical protein PV08_07538 [Exophiala spinifera]|uniref:Uncharacterized protein n=1 Tax=Exophiala spinifera TaxID=91928 RepID=A0A0D2BU01_9EURO|nr:uncharacterized protein PV08_07538 [Exophiala spinifera]KIW14754.1 hypothetical protein PV08_07538 [Exophiala spinifera]
MEHSLSGRIEAGGSSDGTVVATPGAAGVDDNVDQEVRDTLAETPYEEATADETTDFPPLPDLGNIEARHLRRTSNHEARTLERQGLLYTDLYRQLQLRPERYLEFYTGVLWPLRYNHLEEVQRGTPAGHRALTNRLLRRYGDTIWPATSTTGSGWLIDDAELNEGEVRLKYVKPPSRAGASTVPENGPFFTIFDAFWARMRNAIFTIRTQSGGRPRTSSNRNDDPAAAAAALDQTIMFLTREETRASLDHIQARLLEVLQESDPQIFAEEWVEMFGRLQVIESDLPMAPAVVAMVNGTTDEGPPPAMSNEPFISQGNPVRDPQSTVPPTIIPSVMSVWITTVYVPPDMTAGAIDGAIDGAAAAAARSSRPIVWLDAPVRERDMRHFVGGVNARVVAPPSKIKGYMLSYGWSDVCRIIWTGPFSSAERDDQGEETKMETETETALLEQGWTQLRSDLETASRDRVNIWRMKVVVIALP